MTAPVKRGNARSRLSAILDEEIHWLVSFGWSVPRIATRLRVCESTVEKHLQPER